VKPGLILTRVQKRGFYREGVKKGCKDPRGKKGHPKSSRGKEAPPGGGKKTLPKKRREFKRRHPIV